jgi:acyl carrier protein
MNMQPDEVNESLARVVAIVCETGQIAEISADEDFYDAGFTSLRSLQLLLQLETEWDIAIPDEEFIHAWSARSLYELVARVKDGIPCA